MSEKILIVEDEPRVVRLVSEVLKAVGYQVIAAASGKSAIEMVALEQPDLVLLDILLPHGPDGYEVCRHIREFSDVPVIMLTAKAQETDMLQGFDVGADDYLTKPFSAKELVARAKAVLRRTQRSEEMITTPLTCGEIEMDFARRTVKVRGEQVSLTRTEYELLRQLALNANRVMLHQDLLTNVWGQEYRDDIDYLRAYIRYLRRKLEVDPSNPQYILTSSGVGYMLTCPDEGEHQTKTGANLMEKRTIYITEYDAERLKSLISEAKRLDQRGNVYLENLDSELARGQLVAPTEVPPDVITMNSKVCLVDLDTKEEMVYMLVFPQDADIAQSKISILAPIGTAMLGYRVGDVFTWQVPDGVRRLKVKQILYQPEASGDYHL
jgi:two-component system KDP operon response regulator KdpE